MTTPSPRSTRPVVAGVDGSEGSVHALRWAADEARARHCPLVVVVVWTFPTMALLAPPGAPDPAVEDSLRRQAEHVLDRALAQLGDELGGLAVERRVVAGIPAWSLLEAAEDGQLLVVGSRGLGGFRGLLLGSVSHQCVMHAHCPVMVVPGPGRP